MEQQLLQVLQGTLSSEGRAQSEALLEQAQHHEGYCAALLSIASRNAPEEQAVQLAAAIALKNAVKRRWNKADADLQQKGKQPILVSDKQHIRQHLHAAVLRVPDLVRKQLLEVTREIADRDFPDPWSCLLPEVLATLQGGDTQHMMGSLLMLRRVASCLEFASDARHKVMQDFAASVLPLLGQLLQRLAAESSQAPELANLLRIILKIFWSCIYVSIPDVLGQDRGLASAWLQNLLVLLQRPIPSQGMPEDDSEKEKQPWWKLRKWNLRIAFRLISRYGDSSFAPRGESNKAFAHLYVKDFSEPYLKCMLDLTAEIGQGRYCSRHALVYLTRYLVEATKQKTTQSLIAPYLSDILLKVMLPLCFFTPALHAQWTEDPMEVIRKNSTALNAYEAEDLYDVRDAAVHVILEVLKVKALRQQLLEPLMKEIVRIAAAFRQQHDASPASVDVEVAYRMEGATVVLGALMPSVLVKDQRFANALENLANEYLVPLFASPHAFLRSKAVWLAGQYASDLEYSMPGQKEKQRGQGPLFDKLFELTLACMNDSDLPTQVEAVNSFREFVEALDAADRIEERLKPILKDLLSHFFRMASSVEAMDVIITVDTIVERIGEGIQPFAVDCCRELVAVYHKAVAETAGDEDEDALFSALFHIMQPIIKLVDACSELPETLALLEDLLLPMLADMCAHKQEEACEQICELLSYFTYFTRPLTPRLWAFWPLLHDMVMDWGEDYLETAVGPLENFITFGSDTFVSSEAPNYRGRMDEWLWPYLQLSLQRLQAATNAGFATLLMNVLPSALLYNAQATLAVLEAHDKTRPAFEAWFKMVKDHDNFFRRAYDKKLTCMGLASVAALPPDTLPQSIAASFPLLFRELIDTLQRLKEQENMLKVAEGSDSAEEVSEAALNGSASDISVDELDEDEAYLRLLDAKKAQLSSKDDSSGIINMDEWTDDEETESALDAHDPFGMLVLTMNAMQTSHPQRFQELMKGLDDNHRDALREIAQHAQIKSADAAQAQGR